MLELDHVLGLVPPNGDWETRLASAGWALDAGTAHPGQGTRNRRVSWAGQYLELLWVEDADVARRHPLRLTRRADWARTGASPFGFGLRGRLPDPLRPHYWLLDGLPMQVWVHRDDEREPQRPLVFILDLSTLPVEHVGGRTAGGGPASPTNRGVLHAIRHTGPAPARLPPYQGPAVHYGPGSHRLDLTADGGRATTVSDLLLLGP